MELTGKQKSYLKKLVHNATPVVMIGSKGVSDQVLRAINEELEMKELIKIKFSGFKEAKKQLFPEIAEKSQAIAVDLIGNVGILYRQCQIIEDRKIKIPK
ncbi:MAG: hypothetical protein B6226_05195 [Candidatus Cloacimonetes bacterium 4572_65]|nr:MAG: hypothetical protein B6226_05195 [Candidatus Cloacimonetes bacterium 4572_65]